MRERRHLAIALALTAVAVALRVPRVSEGIFGDELLTYNVVSHGGLGHVLRLVHETENNPPLYFILAWLCRQLGHSVAFPGHPMMRLATEPGGSVQARRPAHVSRRGTDHGLHVLAGLAA